MGKARNVQQSGSQGSRTMGILTPPSFPPSMYLNSLQQVIWREQLAAQA